MGEPVPTLLMLLDFVPSQGRAMETFLLRAAHQARSEGWRVVFVFSGEPSVSFADRLRDEGAEYRVTKFPLHRRSYEALAASLDGIRPTVMTNTYMSCFSPYLLRLKRRLGIPHWIAYDKSSGTASAKAGLRRVAAAARGWYYGRHIDRVLAVSEFVARRSVERLFLPESRVSVLPNGVDLDRFRPAPEPDGDRNGEPLVVYVGQLIPEKGVRTLLEAMRLLRQRPAPVEAVLELAGRGPLEGELRAYAAEHGMAGVRFLGQMADVPALYRAATVVVVPSEWAEAFGFVAAEAMACGACILASDAGGLPDVVGRDEEGGRIFRSGDAEDLADKLDALLRDPSARACYRTQARARAERLFGLDDMVCGFVRQLEEVSRRRK